MMTDTDKKFRLLGSFCDAHKQRDFDSVEECLQQYAQLPYGAMLAEELRNLTELGACQPGINRAAIERARKAMDELEPYLSDGCGNARSPN